MQETRNNCFGSKNVARPFFRRNQLSTSAEMQQQRTKPNTMVFVINFNLAIVFGFVRCCCNSALLLNCFRLKKGRDTFFRPETIVASFLHFMVFLPKVLFNHVTMYLHTEFEWNSQSNFFQIRWSENLNWDIKFGLPTFFLFLL